MAASQNQFESVYHVRYRLYERAKFMQNLCHLHQIRFRSLTQYLELMVQTMSCWARDYAVIQRLKQTFWRHIKTAM